MFLDREERLHNPGSHSDTLVRRRIGAWSTLHEPNQPDDVIHLDPCTGAGERKTRVSSPKKRLRVTIRHDPLPSLPVPARRGAQLAT